MESSPPPPVKPPRGIKSPRETSGLLMSVIRTLSSSESNEEREKEKAKLEREYKRTDVQLNELVSHHNKDLTQVMQLFSKISTVVIESREKLAFIKDSLQGCKSLLSCRRDELKKLWLEGIEQKHVSELLEKIEHLKDVPCKLDYCLSSKNYYVGTLLLVRALQLGDGALKDVEALRQLRTDLHSRKEKLYEKLVEELVSYLYDETLNDSDNKDKSKEPVLKKIDSKTESDSNDSQIFESIFVNKDEVRCFESRLKMLIECLSLLNKLPEAVGQIKMKMQTGIFNVMNKVSKNVITNPTEGCHPLLDYFNILVVHLKIIADRHNDLHICLSQSFPDRKDDLNLFRPSDIWSSIQVSLQHMLVDYLDIQSTSSENSDRPSSYSENSLFLSSYFNKRKNRPQRPSLFKFENSLLASSFSCKDSSNYVHGFRRHEPEKLIVCTPHVNNIKIIYNPLLKFIHEIEVITASYSSPPCQLNTFITDYIQKVYLRREMIRVCAKVESVTKTTDTWCRPVSNNKLDAGSELPILQSTFDVSICIKDMESLLETLHGHHAHTYQIMDIVMNIVRLYYDTCNAAYRGIVQPEPEDKRLCSAAWLKDEDISRFLKSLPNWIDLQSRRAANKSKRTLKREDTVEDESPEDIRQRNIKEAEILASNLGESGVSLHEIISEPLHLKSLAFMQESMEWFASRVHQSIRIIKKLAASQSSTDSSALLSQLHKLSQEFEELSNTCLLVLHLEVRVQCFHYLLPKGNSKRFSKQELDPQILELSNVLVVIVDALSCLQPHKIKYVFEGLGHLIAKILMSLTQYTEKIEETTIQKICRNIYTLQQTISNITFTREVALDHARTYFQLFFLPPEDILNRVLEKGPEFSELEYMNVLQLINRSRNNQDQSAIQKHLQKLSDILGEVGVTV